MKLVFYPAGGLFSLVHLSQPCLSFFDIRLFQTSSELLEIFSQARSRQLGNMADPLSIAAGIIAVLQLTTTAVQYLNDIKHGPAECRRILIEVVTVSGFLHTLKALAESMQPDDLQVSALRSLNVPDGPLEQVKLALECLVLKIKPARGLERVSTSLTWSLKKADVNNILASIERQKALFLLAMQNDHM